MCLYMRVQRRHQQTLLSLSLSLSLSHTHTHTHTHTLSLSLRVQGLHQQLAAVVEHRDGVAVQLRASRPAPAAAQAHRGRAAQAGAAVVAVEVDKVEQDPVGRYLRPSQ